MRFSTSKARFGNIRDLLFIWILLLSLCVCIRARATDIIINNEGSLAYVVDDEDLLRLNLTDRTATKIPIKLPGTEEAFQLIGFAPAGQVLGFFDSKVWSFDARNNQMQTLFSAPPGEEIRWAVQQFPSSNILVSLFPKNYDAGRDKPDLSFSVRGLVKLSWHDSGVKHERVKPRREVLPFGGVFDSHGHFFFPLRDVYQARLDEDYDLEGGRCLPVSSERVFTGGASSWTYGARSIAVSDKKIYVYINRLDGSGAGYVVRFQKRRMSATEGYEDIVAHFAADLGSMEILQDDVTRAVLGASANGKYVLIRSNEKWFIIDDDRTPQPLDLK